ncbi:type I polyketide synthase [Nocardia seriolae]|uniref:Polyketide synthase n=1 Tax=Nocardia seriolae TaxID=37332 RepID=A0ABC9Z2G6_9NOCA|nr:type I polyketide synthase [Nocardia seriolae]BEK93643.1 type I polyketide synthase [Nocardia seriolae]GAM49641.1 polyketide synthase [Nocardia seriolae]GAP31601.1 polyketide synthase [Nocardia seriolae]
MSDIAIVGIGCRYAGGIDSPESFWDFIINKGDGVVEIPSDRWDYRRYYDPDRRTPGRMYTKRAAFMTGDPWAFDPDFFGISPREAAAMDPQQRLILEIAWEALDDAGIAGTVSGAPIGVYVGAFTLDQMAMSNTNAALPFVDMHTAAGASYTMISNRIAYALNMVGPALTVDTACSSSLVAFHLACQALGNGDCTVALAGGVTMLLQPEPFVSMCKGGFLAADGRSKPFDARADGYGRGEGSGMVVLKRLDDAERDGDRIYAVVKATGSNQDGRTTAITVPNADLQEALAKTVLERAGVAAHEVTYVEAHGTGTPVGDPLELRAIGNAYGRVEGRNVPLGVGSVKAQLGHTEAASGIASVIKSALAITHRTIAPQGWLNEPNPDIPFEELGLALQLDAQPVPADTRMTLAVNGFGYGGTNSHVILQEYVPGETAVREPRHYGVLPISARNETAARELARGFAELIAAGAEPGHLAEAAWTRRQHHGVRAGLTFGDDTDLVRALVEFAGGEGRTAKVISRKVPEPVFVFTGLGPQWWAMGRRLLTGEGVFAAETQRVFAAEAERIDAVFREISGWSIVEELLRPEEESRVTSTAVAQPANFLIQVALFALLDSLGIRPAAVVGHSVGEVSAAYVTGMLSLRDALRVSYHRARLQATTAGSGGMLAIGLPQAAALELIEGDALVSIAAVNSPSAVTLAGDEQRLDKIAESLTEQGVFARRLQVEVPYHSYLMDPILDELRTALADLELAEPRITLWSTVTGARVTAGDWTAEYWCANVRQPVRFADAITDLVGAGSRVFLEVGPHPVLGANIREILIGAGETGTTIATLNRKQDDDESVRQTLAGLYAAGVLDLDALFGDIVTRHVDLPRYPWQRTRMRVDLVGMQQLKYGTPGMYRMLGDPLLEDPTTAWRIQLSVGDLEWLADHVVGGSRILPGAAYLDAALSAAALRTESGRVAVEDVRFLAPLVVDEGMAPVVELHVEESTRRFTIRSREPAGTSGTINATGRLVEGAYEATKAEVPDLEEMLPIDPDAYYTAFAARGLDYGPAFRRATALRVSGNTVVATLNAEIARDSGHLVHPAVVDAAVQCFGAVLAAAPNAGRGALVPVAVNEVRVFAPLPDEVTVVARLHSAAELTADYDLLDAEQNVVMSIIGLRLGDINPDRVALQRLTDYFYEDRWDMREPVDITALPSPDTAYTLAIDFAAEASARATFAASTTAHGEVLVVGDPNREDLEAVVHERLQQIVALNGVERTHVVLVAGSEYADLDALWALRRVAVTTEGFLEDWLQRRGDEIPMTGDGSLHITLVTERAFAHPDEDAAPDPAHAALAGARRVLLNEQSRLRWRLVDVDPEVAEAELAAELAIPGAFTYDHADEVVLRNGLRWVTVVAATLPDRLEALDRAEPLTDPEANFRLELPKSRVLSRLAWRRCERRAPEAEEVEVRILAVGLGYKDPLKVIGVLGEREMTGTFYGTEPGMEADAVVVRIGSDVTDLTVGDRVFVTSKGMISRFHTTDASLVNRVADGTEVGQCTSTVAFATAEHSLLELALVRAGDVVLVHGAAGGVGSAAVQIAKLHGATVIGTAGSDTRRAYVLAQGADHALDSRSLNFADDVLGLTDGRGADVVISTAPGEILRRNFKAVAEFGRIVEIGKADIYGGGVLELAYFDKNLSYHSFDLDRMLALKRRATGELVQGVQEKLAAGTYRYLPYEVYDTADVARAFEDVARSTHFGRIAVSLESQAPLVRPLIPAVSVDPAANYLITGGFGAFGLAVGRWLTGLGARRLTLLGRGGAGTEAARTQLAAWQEQGVEVVEERVDVTDAYAMTALIARAHTAEHPLRGVFHTAGTLDDKRVPDMTRDSLEKVYRPKAEGVIALRRGLEAAGAELDMFVLFSSGSTIFGSIGQYAYTAANLALNATADVVARQGGKALSVGWGHMSGGGMADDEYVSKYLRTAGFDPIDMAEGTEYLGEALGLGIHHQVAIIPIDWSRVAATVSWYAMTGRTAERIAAAVEDNSAAAQLVAVLRGLDEQKRADVVAHMLAEQLAVVMGVDADSIDLTVPVPELGLDSLMAVEFGALVSKTLGVDLMSMKVGRSFTLQQAGARAAELLVGGTTEAAPA